MGLDWKANDQFYVLVREADVGILFYAERLMGSKRYAAVAIEGAYPSRISLAQFIETGDKFLIGDKFRSLAGAQAACEKYLREARRDIARRNRSGIDVVDGDESTRLFAQRWNWEEQAAQA